MGIPGQGQCRAQDSPDGSSSNFRTMEKGNITEVSAPGIENA